MSVFFELSSRESRASGRYTWTMPNHGDGLFDKADGCSYGEEDGDEADDDDSDEHEEASK